MKIPLENISGIYENDTDNLSQRFLNETLENKFKNIKCPFAQKFREKSHPSWKYFIKIPSQKY